MADKPSPGLAHITAAPAALSAPDGRAGLVTPAPTARRMGGRTAPVMGRQAGGRLTRPGRECAGQRALTWTPLDRR